MVQVRCEGVYSVTGVLLGVVSDRFHPRPGACGRLPWAKPLEFQGPLAKRPPARRRPILRGGFGGW